jgi:hypothetical protein
MDIILKNIVMITLVLLTIELGGMITVEFKQRGEKCEEMV